ncbi:LuxR C-terminal-related transcriptional regulator [Pseudonocardia sp. RS11V-5]|uniref:helix-turn-helix transcriptional regulator n=1 Tax=Pseudonocardia terrae TaxID=2905831 RepID=UPI001E2A212F|nr:LuxR C-terminal-related transcriptional regulator [Pseudonocardia terrae]MCE3551197.1 LuxR C-terminal-related transcriptional regulator [Pseudonocardia terrae]
MDTVAGDRNDPLRGTAAADSLVTRAGEALTAVVDALGGPDTALPAPHVEDLETASDSLHAAERALRRHLAAGERCGEPPTTTALTLLVQVQALRLAVGEARMARRAKVTEQLHRAVTRLRAGLGVADLLRQVPLELGEIGYSRSLFSALRGTAWTPEGAFAHGDDSLADALLRVGGAMPGRIGREEPETEAVRRRTPILVRNAQSRLHIHRELISLADTRDYAAAPVVAHGSVIALLHVDRHSQADVVDAGDRDLLGLFADAVGLAFERARYQERFTALKSQFERQLTGIDDLLYGTAHWPSTAEPSSVLDADPGVHPFLADGPLGELTRREFEVLRHLARGASNQDIAERLGVSTGTVKTHMKHVLRKLGAANRAEAAARFHGLGRSATG